VAKRKGNRSGRRKARSAKGAPQEREATRLIPVPSDMSAILGHFAQALSMTVVCQRSLAAQELAAVGDEEETLREGIRLLRHVYNELDGAAR